MQNSKSMMAVAAFLILLPVFIFFNVPYINSDAIVMITFIINAILFSGGILFELKKYSFSLNLMYWIFMYFFMFLAPFIQYTNNKYPLDYAIENPNNDELFLCNITILFFSIAWILGGFIKKKPQQTKINSYITTDYESSYNKKYYVLFFISLIVALYALYSNGIMGIFSSQSEAYKKFYSGNNQSISLIINISLPAMLTFSVFSYFSVAKTERKHFLVATLCLICLIICFFPTTISRYMAATIYIGLLILLIPKMHKGTLFFWIFVLGLFIVFPFLNLFRYNTDISMMVFFRNLKNNFLVSYTEGHYDAYMSLIITFRYIAEQGCTFGRQVIGGILFFIPRSIWPNKPIGSGAMMINYFSPGSFSNVSCTLIAECLLNFGWVSIIIVPIILGSWLTKLDFNYHSIKIQRDSLGTTPYIFLISLVFFLLRGDFMSGFAYTFGFMLVGYIIKIFLKKRVDTNYDFIRFKD